MDATVYRKEIAAFQQQHGKADVHTLQRALLDSTTADISQTDHSKTLRRKDTPRSNDGTPEMDNCRSSRRDRLRCFLLGVRFSLENADASTEGWIVQKVSYDHYVRDASDTRLNPVDLGGWDPSWAPYWEGWQVRGGQVFIGAGASLHNADTYGSPGLGDNQRLADHSWRGKFLSWCHTSGGHDGAKRFPCLGAAVY